MRSLYVELLRRGDRTKWKTVDQSSLLPILKGNNIVIERFVISTSFFGRDKYRMYLKIGARAKMPDEVRLPENVYDRRLGNASININTSTRDPQRYIPPPPPPPPKDKDKGADSRGNSMEKNNQGPGGNRNRNNRGGRGKQRHFSDYRIRLFSGNNNGGNGGPPLFSGNFSPNIDLSYEVRELLGEAIKYDKRERSLVLEFKSIDDSIRALNILPFGVNYNIYLLT